VTWTLASVVTAILKHYKANGIRRIVALRGDMPSGLQGAGELRHASDLVDFIRSETGDHFHIPGRFELAKKPQTSKF
jgi:5,10-methylenetetrahydrofolate reductase